ncbi:hypothetical protein AB0K51_20500 [Kitasatospora sp. NPDC049285]|uniref:hypothetical protein n=1 Tax=Kitasatospora sp. NPDC049285 TaxID=3157096 RepID=UPI0034128034
MRPQPLLTGLAALTLAAACTRTAAPPSADHASPSASAGYDAPSLRELAVTDADLGPGWHVTVMQPGQGDITSPPQTADAPACQPVLDALAPAKGSAGPLAEADLDIARTADDRASLYTAILAFRPGRAAVVHTELDQVLIRCRVFTSGAGRHVITRLDTPTPEGADAATAFTLTNETGGATLTQRALLTRTGDILTVFTTLDTTGHEPAAPDAEVIKRQLGKLQPPRGPGSGGGAGR